MGYMRDATARRLDGLPVTSATKGAKSVAGSSNITLTAAECGVRVLELTGATQALTITVPTGRSFSVTNSTDYAHLLKRSGSTKTVTLDPGATMEVQS